MSCRLRSSRIHLASYLASFEISSLSVFSCWFCVAASQQQSSDLWVNFCDVVGEIQVRSISRVKALVLLLLRVNEEILYIYVAVVSFVWMKEINLFVGFGTKEYDRWCCFFYIFMLGVVWCKNFMGLFFGVRT